MASRKLTHIDKEGRARMVDVTEKSETFRDISIEVIDSGARIEATARTKAETGVEMEAMTAVSVSALTLYDMCKAVEKGISIGPLRLLEKSGGKSGHWVRHI